MKRILRRLFTVEETYMNVSKEYKEWVKKNEALKTFGNTDKKTLVVKLHSLEKQLEQVFLSNFSHQVRLLSDIMKLLHPTNSSEVMWMSSEEKESH
jgi:hypothetical protein